MKKKIAFLLTFVATCFAGVTIKDENDKLVQASGTRLKLGINALLDQNAYDGGKPYPHPTKAALYFAASSPADEGYKGDIIGDDINRPTNLITRGLNDPHVKYGPIGALPEKDRPAAIEKSNQGALALRKQLITAATSSFYLEYFARETTRVAIVQPTPAGTNKRIDVLQGLIDHALSYIKTLDDDKLAAEKEWYAVCDTAWKVQLDAYDKTTLESESSYEKTQAVKYRFNFFAPGQWKGEDTEDLTKVNQNRFIETFILRRIWTDGMSKEQITKVLTAFYGAAGALREKE